MPGSIASTTMDGMLLPVEILHAHSLLLGASGRPPNLRRPYSPCFIVHGGLALAFLLQVDLTRYGIDLFGICSSVASHSEVLCCESMYMVLGGDEGCHSVRAWQPVELPVTTRTRMRSDVDDVRTLS